MERMTHAIAHSKAQANCENNRKIIIHCISGMRSLCPMVFLLFFNLVNGNGSLGHHIYIYSDKWLTQPALIEIHHMDKNKFAIGNVSVTHRTSASGIRNENFHY